MPNTAHKSQGVPGSTWLGRPQIVAALLWILTFLLNPFGHRLLAIEAKTQLGELVRSSWTDQQGLPHNVVRAIGQDSRHGYIWVATENGLARFDGSSFKVYDSHNTPAIRINKFTSLCFGPKGLVWAGTEGGGLVRIGADPESIVNLGKTNGLSDERVNFIVLDRHGRLHACTTDFLINSWVESESRFVQRDPFDGGPRDEVTCVASDGADGFWVGTIKSGLIYFNGRTRKQFRAPSFLSANRVDQLLEGADGTIWGTCVDMSVFRIINGVPEQMPSFDALNGEKPHSLMLAHSGEHWISTSRGRLLSFKNGLPSREFSPDELFSETATSIYEDRDGTVWVGVFEGGLHRMAESSAVVYSPTHGVVPESIRSILPGPDGSIWVGGESMGLLRFDAGKWENFHVAEGLAILTIAPARGGGILLGGKGSGLIRYPGDNKPLYTARDHPAIADIRAILQDADGTIWTGTREGGLLRMRGSQISQYSTNQGLPHREVRSVFRDSRGNLWIGTFGGGLCLMDGEHFQRIKTTTGEGDYRVKSISEDAHGELWVGTLGHGMGLLKNKRLRLLTPAEGCPDVTVNAVLHDEQGISWVAGERAIFHTSYQMLNEVLDSGIGSVSFTNLAVEAGIQIPTPNGGSQSPAALLPGGIQAFGTRRGLLLSFSSRSHLNRAATEPFVEALDYDNIPTNLDFRGHLKPGHGALSIKFTALNLKDSRFLAFEHRLDGVDPDWRRSPPSRMASYTLLPPRDYRFQVRAKSIQSDWSVPAVLTFTIEPHFYQTFWFKILCVAIISGMLMLAFKALMKMQADGLAIARIKSIESEKNRIARDLHDDMGAHLQQILGWSDDEENRAQNPQPPDLALQKIAGTCRTLLLSLNQIVWTTTPANDTLESLASYLQRLTQELTREAGVHSRFDFPVNLPALVVRAEVRHHVYLAIKESLNNALKHSNATLLHLAIAVGKKDLSVSLEDNGSGFDQLTLKSGAGHHGLLNLHKRLELIGATCSIDSKPGRGTIVVLKIPLSQLTYRTPKPWLLGLLRQRDSAAHTSEGRGSK